MLFYQKPLLRAFLNGRKCTTNLYYQVIYDDALLNTSLGEIKKKVGIDRMPEKNKTSDYLLFACYCILLLAVLFLCLYVPVRILIWLV